MLTEIKKNIAIALSEKIDLDIDNVIAQIEIPKNIQHGHLAYPVFSLAKKFRKAPNKIAEDLASTLNDQKLEGVHNCQSVGGYLNFQFSPDFLQNKLTEALNNQGARIGFSNSCEGKKMIIDYSSPNVAKPMGIGHLRATVIGQAIRNLAESQGYKVIGLNYLGDWGVQFGKLAWAFKNWKDEYDFEKAPFETLYKMYVRFHEEAEEDPELEKKGSECFKKLEDGDEEILNLWQMFLDITIKEHQKLYDLLNIKFDLIQGESFHNKDLLPTVKLLESRGLLEQSQGARVVFLDSGDPPCIIQKSDGSSLYATRDIASAVYRHDVLKGDEILYVVGVDQTLHFKQVFQVLKKLNYSWAENCHHIAFGLYRFKDQGKMSTRRGTVIFMDDVLQKAIEMVSQTIDEKNPDLKDKKLVAQQVGVGAVVFNDLFNDRVKNVDFDWKRALDFEGDSGPYVQYTNVRCLSLMRKWKQEIPKQFTMELDSEEESRLVAALLNYSEVLTQAYRHYKPNLLAQYVLDLCKGFNQFYHKNRILDAEPEVALNRMTLVWSTQSIIESGLKILGIPAPENM